MRVSVLLSLLFIALSQVSFGQETLGEIPYRVEQGATIQVNQNALKRSRSDVKITYLLNTLQLPIIDDFSTNKIKNFPRDTSHPQVFDSTSYLFRANDLPLDTLRFKRDTVYNYFINPLTLKLDSVMASVLKVVFYDTGSVFTPIDSVFVFPNYSFYTENGNTRKIEYTADSIFINKSRSNFYAHDDNYSYWIAKGPFLNYTLGIDQPTLGVLTFDGLDSLGLPYDNSSRLTYGLSDFLYSKPINLFDRLINGSIRKRYSVNDSIYLSFFFQPMGNGDRPETEDSLILDFYDVAADKWNRIWGVPGDSIQAFKRVSFHIGDLKYLQNGFRFRLKNYATQSGNFDHWHLDYIRLIEKGGKNDEIKDFAIIDPIRSMIKDYTSMPWKHFKTDPKKFMMDTVILELRNLTSTSDNLEANYKVFTNSSENPFFRSKREVRSSLAKRTSLAYNINSAPNFFSFPTDTLERQWFRVNLETAASQDVNNRNNDTLKHAQIFDRYYSYDDNSAEKTYHLNLVGTNIAVRFNCPVRDTLKSVMINFVETFEKINNQKINIKVYKNLVSAPIYESGPIDVIKTPPGKFYRYHLPKNIVVEGDFYIGWEQLSIDKTFVGYDINFNNQKNTFISEVEGQWFNSAFTGTILLRADFGDGSEDPLSVQPANDQELSNMTLFPNPSNGAFSIKGGNDQMDITLINLQGKILFKWTATNGQQLTTPDILPGLYFVNIKQEGKTTQTLKLIINQ